MSRPEASGGKWQPESGARADWHNSTGGFFAKAWTIPCGIRLKVASSMFGHSTNGATTAPPQKQLRSFPPAGHSSGTGAGCGCSDSQLLQQERASGVSSTWTSVPPNPQPSHRSLHGRYGHNSTIAVMQTAMDCRVNTDELPQETSKRPSKV